MTNGIFCENRKAKKKKTSKDLNEYQLNNWHTLKKSSKNKSEKMN